MKDQELDELLASLREESWPEERMAAWRNGVRERVERRGRRWWIWLPAPVLAAAFAAWIVLIPPKAPVEEMTVAVKSPAVAEVAWQRIEPRKERRTERRAVARAQAERISSEFIQIVTDDPDVVILWAVNGKGDE